VLRRFAQLRSLSRSACQPLGHRRRFRTSSVVHNISASATLPPKYAVAQIVGYIKGKSAIHIARTYGGKKRNFVGQSFWARGYFVSTVGRDETVIRQYIRNQETEEARLDQLSLLR